jgi:hypothetical protein
MISASGSFVLSFDSSACPTRVPEIWKSHTCVALAVSLDDFREAQILQLCSLAYYIGDRADVTCYQGPPRLFRGFAAYFQMFFFCRE